MLSLIKRAEVLYNKLAAIEELEVPVSEEETEEEKKKKDAEERMGHILGGSIGLGLGAWLLYKGIQGLRGKQIYDIPKPWIY